MLIERQLTEKDYIVLSKVFNLKENRGLSKASACTVEEINERINKKDKIIATTTIRLSLKYLLQYNFIDVGIRKGRSNTYFVTAEGINELNSVNKTCIEIIKKDK